MSLRSCLCLGLAAAVLACSPHVRAGDEKDPAEWQQRMEQRLERIEQMLERVAGERVGARDAVLRDKKKSEAIKRVELKYGIKDLVEALSGREKDLLERTHGVLIERLYDRDEKDPPDEDLLAILKSLLVKRGSELDVGGGRGGARYLLLRPGSGGGFGGGGFGGGRGGGPRAASVGKVYGKLGKALAELAVSLVGDPALESQMLKEMQAFDAQTVAPELQKILNAVPKDEANRRLRVLGALAASGDDAAGTEIQKTVAMSDNETAMGDLVDSYAYCGKPFILSVLVRLTKKELNAGGQTFLRHGNTLMALSGVTPDYSQIPAGDNGRRDPTAFRKVQEESVQSAIKWVESNQGKFIWDAEGRRFMAK